MNTTLDMLEEYLREKGAFTNEIHPLVVQTLNVISGEIPFRLKLAISLNELAVLTSHLRKNIELHDGTIVPCNMITFALAKSGVSKDSSMNMVRKALNPGYVIINDYRKQFAQHRAEQRAILDGKPKEDWLSYYEKPRDLQAGLGTVEGLIQHFAELEKGDAGAGYISSSEIGTELLTNGNMTDIIKTISIAYDLGKIPAKIIKNADSQTESIQSLPISALFFGSEDAILYDNSVKAKFRTIFTTQFARRSIFSFTPEIIPPIQFKTIQELQNYRDSERESTMKAQAEVKEIIIGIVEGTDSSEPLKLTPEAQTMFDVYKEYNQLIADSMKAQYPITKLARRHKQWLTLKLSGNLAILDNEEQITEKHYVQALNIVEHFSEDLQKFETELIKEPYEIFAEFCKHNAENGKLTITTHTLRKLGYIPTTGNAKSRIEELVHLVSSYDQEAIYTACDEGICYEEQVKTDVAGLSYLEVSGTKEERAHQCATGFQFYETDFEELGSLLAEDFAYSPFHFKDGIRGKDNILGGCKFVALDIDKSTITDEECHLLLEGLNHHIARTSDAQNQFKFRVLVELDSIVDIPDRQWKYFLEAIGTELGLQVDILAKSQIYFAYEGREVLSELEGSPLETRNLIMKSAEKLSDKPSPKKMTTVQQKTLLDDPLETFNFAFNAEDGTRSRSLIRAAYYAKDLGATTKEIIDLMDKISEYWTEPAEDKHLEAIKSQIMRF